MKARRIRLDAGLSMIELMVVLAVIGIMAAIATPSMSKMFANQRLKDSAFDLAAALNEARSQAIRTGNIHLVFYGTDALGATLYDASSNPVRILILDEGRPGSANQNCKIDGGEPIQTVAAVSGISRGVTGVTSPAPSDLGSGDITTGSSFTEPGGNDATWVMFRPEGMPVSFDSGCTTGKLGSGAGAFYLTNADRTSAVVLMPTGRTRVHSYQGGWSS